MVAKILSSSSSFRAVEYNTDKISKDKGELMEVKNFGYLQAIDNLRPQDYINYLQSISNVSSKIKNPQFHAALSCKGNEYDKFQLTDLAVKWMEEMGYGDQPYLIIFHNDTDNNHVHLVSTRVDQFKYKKINDSFEKLKAVEIINNLTNDISHSLDIENAKKYNFSTEAQFKFLLEKKGYSFRNKDDLLEIIKFGKVLDTIKRDEIKGLAKEKKPDLKRMGQLKAIVSKYKNLLDGSLVPEYEQMAGKREGDIIGYYSQLSNHLKAKFGIEMVFHFSGTKEPYGYTLFDHANKNVFKGGEIMPLKELIKNGREVGKDWIKNVLNQLKTDKATFADFDVFLKGNDLKRVEDQIFDKNNNRIFQLDKADFQELKDNSKASNSFIVFNEADKMQLSEMYSLPLENIEVKPLQSMYIDLLQAVVYNYPSIDQGLNELNFSLIPFQKSIYLMDNSNNTFINIKHITNNETQNIIFGEFSYNLNDTPDIVQDDWVGNDLVFTENELAEKEMEDKAISPEGESFDGGFNFFIADDVDDEAIHGRNRKRKKHARGNSR